MAENIRILSTKTLLSNQKQFLLNANLSVVEADFIETKSLPILANAQINEALIFTSQNAVNTVLGFENIEDLKAKKVFCVGLKTKALLEENGFQVEAYTGYAEDLAEIISLVYADSSYTFFSGNLRRDVLPEKLKEAEISFNEIEVYETILTPQKMTSTGSANGNSTFDGILFYSPSGVESYTKQNKIADEICFCIGNTTAEALEHHTKNIIVANQPSVENVIIQCINYFSRKH
ncbi:uroporphyrinogen-III synthase [Flavobacterium terrae]|uniref:Uroporphyrinogen-III synthase n=1 Tax=Flavobacterium terrae TaxID=415425 RepID=A0A1M6ANS3_9FLAO|nr:uroporphyrinogen-III synthase [Flavobacterium terrae]SHI38105.1 uroporphyrinogen-III synthase [Flavobacterium terrae]